MAEVTIRLNRLGLEHGRMWQAVLAAVAIALPVAVWLGLERALGDSVQNIGEGDTLFLQSYPVAGAGLEYELPGSGWTSPGVHFADQRQNFVLDHLTASVEVDSGVDSLERLLDRRVQTVIAQNGYVYNNVRPYEHAGAGLAGYRADIIGIDSAGSITVVGNDKGAAAILVLIAPGADPGAKDLDPDPYVATFTLEGK
ncbi:hypothetical protein GCM10009853_013130 [Glycomyces scopariae]|uniref:Uncharacterized protein n=1 Tax=Glycomyces sambucus TaxID=380244 RepID=A0A1G9MRS9_9ACTN|nr:hypothetical protein [Glycomyces sambucus]SDL77002.1 hypothetical protein SAMN05216298_5146 [Glycomyces sambucus]